MSPSVRLLVDLRHICTLHVINTTGASSVWATTRPDMWKLCLMKQPQSELRVRVSAVLYISLHPSFLLSILFPLMSSYVPYFLSFSDLLLSYIRYPSSSLVSNRLSSFLPSSPFNFLLSTFLHFIRSFIIPLFL